MKTLLKIPVSNKWSKEEVSLLQEEHEIIVHQEKPASVDEPGKVQECRELESNSFAGAVFKKQRCHENGSIAQVHSYVLAICSRSTIPIEQWVEFFPEGIVSDRVQGSSNLCFRSWTKNLFTINVYKIQKKFINNCASLLVSNVYFNHKKLGSNPNRVASTDPDYRNYLLGR